MGVRFDENELFDLTTRLMQVSSQEERDMIRQELVNAVTFIQDEEDAENGIEYKIDFDMINADMKMNCDDDDDGDFDDSFDQEKSLLFFFDPVISSCLFPVKRGAP